MYVVMFKSILLNFSLTIIWLLVFLKGYFPVSNLNAPIIKPPSSINSHYVNITHTYKPYYDRLILVVIDALREDFITEDYMPYTYKEQSCLIPVKVEAPTVTLPRIKAITTGSVPQFVDIILNLGSPVRVKDSFLHRAFGEGKNMVFYGDNIWLKIYPDMFIRKDGTTSFYVNDFTEVDNNVTRHIKEEIQKDDWDMLFLHYLGLDHIGHVRGPFSDLIKPKLREMDSVIHDLNEASKTWNKNTLLLITGDHGMKDSGGHGGTSYAETHVPLIAFGSTCGDRLQAEQTDIPTTLSVLFGIQIHSGSIGKIIPDFFTSYEPEKLLYSLYYNLLVISSQSETCDEYNELITKHSEFLNNRDSTTANYLIDLYQKCLHTISGKLVRSSVEQDVTLITFSLIMTTTCLLFIVHDYVSFCFNNETNYRIIFYLYITTIIFTMCYKFSISFMLYLFLQTILTLYAIFKFIKITAISVWHCNGIKPYIILIILHALLLQSSSFVEEEHLIWYYYTGTVSVVTFYFFIKESFPVILIIISTLRFLRTLNSTGDKWASYPDLGDWFLIEKNTLYYQLFYILGLILTYESLNKISKVDNIQKLLYGSTIFLTFIYKMLYSNVDLAKGIWCLIIITSLRGLTFRYPLPVNLTNIWILIITLLLRPYNAILIPSCILYSYLYTKHIKNVDILSTIHMWLGYTLYFCQGHSNSIASVDISSSYIGLNSYIPILVGFFTLCHTYAFPILSILLLLIKYPMQSSDIFVINIINRLWILIVIYLTVLIQRGHLFVWSVFAPKLLIESVHTLVLFMFLCFYSLLNFISELPIKY